MLHVAKGSQAQATDSQSLSGSSAGTAAPWYDCECQSMSRWQFRKACRQKAQEQELSASSANQDTLTQLENLQTSHSRAPAASRVAEPARSPQKQDIMTFRAGWQGGACANTGDGGSNYVLGIGFCNCSGDSKHEANNTCILQASYKVEAVKGTKNDTPKLVCIYRQMPKPRQSACKLSASRWVWRLDRGDVPAAPHVGFHQNWRDP